MENQNAQGLTDVQITVLSAFVRALGQETHVLTRHPELLWQQMYNSLRPLEVPDLVCLLEEEANRRHSQLWLRRRGGAGAMPIRVLASLASGVESCDWSAASGLLGIGCRDGAVYILDPRTGDPLALGAHKGPVSCCHFTPDGSFLISGSKDSTLYVFEIATRKLCRTFHGHQSPVTCLAVLPNGRHVVSGSQDRTLIIWDLKTLEVVKTLRGHNRGVLCCNLSMDGSRLASGDIEGRVVVWEMPSFEPLLSFIAHDDAVLSCALNHSGDILVTGAADATARIWRLNNTHLPTELKGHADEVAGCAFAGDDLVVTVGADQTIRVWIVSTGLSVAAARGHGGPITCLSMESDGSTAYTGDTSGAVLAWAVAELGSEVTSTGHSAAVTSAAVAPRGYVATSSLDGSAIIWHISDGSILHRFHCEEPLAGCAFRRGGATLITAGSHGSLVEWDIATGTQQRTISRGMDVVLGCASDPLRGSLVLGTMIGLTVIEPDGGSWRFDLQVESDSEADQARLWGAMQSRTLPLGVKRELLELMQEREIMRVASDRISAQCVAVQPGGRLAAAGDAIGRVTVVDLLSHSVIRVLKAPACGPLIVAGSVALAPNSENLAVGYSNGIVAVYSLRNDNCVAQWREEGSVLACAFSGDSQLLAIGTEGKYLSVWRWHERVKVYHMPMSHAVRACAFSSNAPILVCADAGGTVCILEMIGLDS